MDHPAFRLLLLEHGNHSLEDHTKDLVFLAPLTHYPDSSLLSFYRIRLNTTTRAQLSGDADDDTSPTLDPEPSQTSPRLMEPEPKPTTDGEPEPRATEVDLIFSEDIEMELPAYPEQSVCLELSTCLNFPPTLPLLSPSSTLAALALPPLFPDSPSAHPQPTICAVGSPWVCQSPSASGLEDPSSSLPASESWTPPRPSDPVAPSRLSAPSSPLSPVGPPAPPGSLVPPASPWSVVVPPSPQLLRLRLPPAPPQSSGASSLPRSPEPWAPPWPSGSSMSPRIIGSPSPPAPPPSVGPLESSALPPPWLLPPSAPLWATIMAAAWVSLGTCCSGSLLSPPWLLLPSDPPLTLLSPPWLLPPSSPPWTLFVVLLLGVRPPPKPPPTMTLLPSHVHSFVFIFSTARSYAFQEGGVM
ncbi:Titin [Labeo rohita]|uniref:Titin n=1 Tax=Labeo rohita TaxID=84645 RepID=A0ABQ8L3J6_LABRO|nr:Titin [Labeo rohita]